MPKLDCQLLVNVPKHTYTAVPLYEGSYNTAAPKRSQWHQTVFTLGCISFAMILGFMAGDFADLGWTHASNEAGWSHELAAFTRTPTKFQGSFNFTNQFRGPPSKEIDFAWDRFSANPIIDGTASIISVTLEDIKRSNKTGPEDSVGTMAQYAEESGGGYMGSLELFHQLHCLNMLRKAVHSEYYIKMRPGPDGLRNATLATHLDHCIEILRQVISCNGDIGLITYHWVKGNPTPYPDFNTWHQCRDPEAILAWSKKRDVPVAAPLRKHLFPAHLELEEAP